MNQKIMFCLGMAVLSLICSLFFVGFMYSYKKRRMRDDKNKFKLKLDIVSGGLMFLFPVAVYLYFFKYLNNKLSVKVRF